MAQLPQDRAQSDTAADHVDDHNEVHRLHNLLDDGLAADGDVILRVATGWDARTPALAGLSETGHGHSNAIHDDASGEIASITAKAAPTGSDLILIEDAAQANAKKRVTVESLRSKAVAITLSQSPYSPDTEDDVILVDTSAGAVTVNLPAVSSVDLHSFLIKRVAGGSNVVIQRAGADVIDTDGDTVTTKTLATLGAQWAGTALDSTSRWYTIGEHGTVS